MSTPDDIPTVIYTHYEITAVHGLIPSMTTGTGPEIRFRFLDRLLPPIGCTSDVRADVRYKNIVRDRVRNAIERHRWQNESFPSIQVTRIVIGAVRADAPEFDPSLPTEVLMAMTGTQIGFSYNMEDPPNEEV